MTKNVLKIETAPLDDVCKSVLRKLVHAGFDKAGVNYMLEAGELGENHFAYLLRHGAMRDANGDGFGYQSVLRKYVTSNGGPEVGKIGFILNFDLE